MPKKNYENMWHELKSNVERNIISVYPEVNEHVPDYRAGQYNILEELGSQIDEVEEVYAKAKAFDEISDVIKKAEFYDRDTALDVIEIVEDLEDK